MHYQKKSAAQAFLLCLPTFNLPHFYGRLIRESSLRTSFEKNL